jgi:hypothetical protein
VQDLRQVQKQVYERGESHKHQLAVKQVRTQLVQAVVSVQTLLLVQLAELEPVPPEWISLARTLVQQRQVLQVPVLLEQKQLRQQNQLTLDVRQLEQLYLLQHRLQEVFQQLVKESQYQPCQ